MAQVNQDDIATSNVILVHPVRFLPRTRLLHFALPDTEWTLCERSRVGSPADESDLGTVVGGVALTLCTRCDVRRKLIQEGRPVGRGGAPAVG
ncbi:MAG: hypothetical protein LH616_08345 [Ilumatobacteraceae bacterium]|nr:hypothetical protein [Ilumatobacteraceae bacterium]